MKKKLIATINEALVSVLPITIIVFLLSVFVSPLPVGTLMLFLFGAVLLIVGMGFFTMGAEMSLTPIGEDIGIAMTNTKKLLLVSVISFAMGVIITIAEPDLQVLAQLTPGIPNMLLVMTVACGVGVFLMFCILRILFRISLSKMLIISYIVTVALSFFVPDHFRAVAFDSGGVTTGPITVPFILAMGLGLSSIRSDRDSLDDSFGLVALCSIGPILAVLILGICFNPASTGYTPPVIPVVETSRDVTFEFIGGIPHQFISVVKALWPLLALLAGFQLITRRYHKRQLARILIGYLYTFIGLVLFLTGVDVGFIPVGQTLGSDIASSSAKWLLIPLGALIGYFIVAAEPAVHVLKKQVEEVSGGAIPSAAVQQYLSIGVSVSLALSMLRVLTGISLYFFLIPGYAIALVLTFFVPKIFTGLAFDSGGVVTGPMTSTFLLPFTMGACLDPSKIMVDAFGVVAMIAMTPLVTLQIMGLIYNKKMLLASNVDLPVSNDDDIIEFEEDIPDDRS